MSELDPELVAAVREAWSRALGIDASSIDPEKSDFFDIGGYSLLALQVIGGLIEHSDAASKERSFEIEGRLVEDLFQQPFCVAQARILQEERVVISESQANAS